MSDADASKSTDDAPVALPGMPAEPPPPLPVTVVPVAVVTVMPAATKRIWLKRALVGASIFAGLLLIALLGALLYFNNAYFKEKITTALKDALQRDVEVEEVSVSILSGKVSITGVRILRTENALSVEKETVRIESITTEFSPLSLVFSGGRKLNGLKLEIVKPEFVLERYTADQGLTYTTSIDDMVKHLTSGPPGEWPKNTGLKALGFEVSVRGGRVLFYDRVIARDKQKQLVLKETKLGDCSLNDINVMMQQTALGEPLNAKVICALKTPPNPAGRTEAEATLNWIDADGQISARSLRDVHVQVLLEQMDIPHLARYAGFDGKMLEGRREYTLGKPHTSSVKVTAATLESITVSATASSDGAISIYSNEEQNRGALIGGNVPGFAQIDTSFGFKEGKFQQGPLDAEFLVASSRAGFKDPAKQLLVLKIKGPEPSPVSRRFDVDFRTADALFSSDLAEALGLKGQFGGELNGQISAEIGNRIAKFNAKLKSKDMYAMYDGQKQDTSMEVLLDAVMHRTEDGAPESLTINTLSAKGNSFNVSSNSAIELKSLNDDTQLFADVDVSLQILGREFFRDFSPLLKVKGMPTPLHEAFLGSVKVKGQAGNLAVHINCSLAQQDPDEQSPITHNPVALQMTCLFNAKARNADIATPFLTYDTTLSTDDKSIYVKAAGSASSDAQQRIVDLANFRALGDLRKLQSLNQRFDAYVSMLLGKQYDLAGAIDFTGRSKLVEKLNADGHVTGRTLTVSTQVGASNLAIKGPHPFSSATLKLDALNWIEQNLSLQLNATLIEEGKSRLLTLTGIDLQSPSITASGNAGPLNVAELSRAMDALQMILQQPPQADLQVKATQAGMAQLQQNHFAPTEPLAIGDMTLKAEIDAKARKLSISALQFKNSALDLNFSAEQIDLPELAALRGEILAKTPLTKTRLLKALPSFNIKTKPEAAISERLQKLGILPLDTALIGAVDVSANYDATTKTLDLREMSYKGLLAGFNISAQKISAQKLAAVLDIAPMDLFAAIPAFEQGLTINMLEIVPQEACQLLQRMTIQNSFITEVLAGTYLPGAHWRLDNLALRPADANTFDLSFSAQTPLQMFELTPKGRSTIPFVSISGSWGIDAKSPARLDINGDKLSGQVSLILDGAAISIDGGSETPLYQKAAGVPCRITFNGGRDTPTDFRASVLSCAGGPVHFIAQNVACSLGDQPVISLENLSVTQGPIIGVVKDVKLDQKNDRLKFVLELQSVDTAQVPPIANLHFKNHVRDVQVSYDGSLSNLNKQLLTTQDTAAFKMTADKLRLEGHAPGETVSVNLDGELSGNTFKLSARQLSLGMDYQPTARKRSINQLLLDLDVSAQDPQQMLLNAAAQPGLPLIINVPIRSESAVDFALLDGISALASSAAPKRPGAPEGDLSGIRLLKVNTALSAPEFVLGSASLSEVNAPAIYLDNLLLRIPTLKAKFAGGNVLVQNQSYNLQTKEHSTDFQISGVDLQKATATPKPVDGAWSVFGTLGVGGKLAGKGFDRPDRRSWQGTLKINIADLVLQKGEGKEPDLLSKDSALKYGLKGLGVLVDGGEYKENSRVANALSEELFNTKHEFQPFEIITKIEHGRLFIGSTTLVGKGRSDGLQIEFSGVVDLFSETLDKDKPLVIYLTKLPARMQEILRMDQLGEADRQAIVTRFAERRFEKIVLTGSISAPELSIQNQIMLLNAFKQLDREIDGKLRAKNPPQPGADPASQPPAKSDNPLDRVDEVLNLFGGKKKKK
jgi:hypothetical protein